MQKSINLYINEYMHLLIKFRNTDEITLMKILGKKFLTIILI